MKYNMFLVLLLSLTVACSDFLNVRPVTFVGGEDYYSTEEQIITAVNGVYGRLQGVYTGNLYVFTEMRSDNTTFFYNPNNRCCVPREEVDYFLMNSVNDRLENNWLNLYNAIQQSNVVLNRIGDVEIGAAGLRERLIGEVKFLRAFCYFHLVRLHGAVPLKTEEIRSPDQVFSAEKASVDEVYDQILLDVKEAANNLPPQYSGSDVGRVTKGAALTLLGDVYLAREDFEAAASVLEEVVRSGQYELLADYASVFDPSHKNHKESIFEVQYSASIDGENSNFIFIFGPWNAGVELTGYQGQLESMNIPTPDMIRAYEEGDLRKDASVGFYIEEGNRNYEEAIGDSLPYIKKYHHPPYAREGQSDDNWPVYRYAEVLLMLAESLNEQGQISKSVEYLNLVRTRAGLEALSISDQSAMREAILQERRVELAFENKRWYDLLRSGRAIEVMTKHGEEERNRLRRITSEMFHIEEYQLLYPIPAREIRLNKLEQNHGW